MSSCVICLDASTDARRSCSSACTARTCSACLIALLDRGKQRCVVCGSCFLHSAVVRACEFSLQKADGADLAKRYVKLAIAYSGAGKPRLALRMLVIAQRHAVPGFTWEHFMKLEIASNLLAIRRTSLAESCLRSVMPEILEMPKTRSSGLLFAECCTLLCKTSVQRENYAEARSWLRRAMQVEDSLELHGPLANSLQLDAQILSCEGNLQLAKESLITASHVMSRCETDECLKCKVQLDIAEAEKRLGQYDPARARLSAVISTLRRRRDRQSAKLLRGATRALSCIVSPKRRLRRKTWPEKVESRVAS